MYTSELFNEITDRILLNPTAEYELKKILICLDNKEMWNDLEEE